MLGNTAQGVFPLCLFAFPALVIILFFPPQPDSAWPTSVRLFVWYHLECLGPSPFFSGPPASWLQPLIQPSSFAPSACCQNCPHQSGTLAPWTPVPIRLSSGTLYPFALVSYRSLFGLTFSVNLLARHPSATVLLVHRCSSPLPSMCYLCPFNHISDLYSSLITRIFAHAMFSCGYLTFIK